ncbi:integrase [Pseudomonas sp. PNP]|uniref:integrase n=1 Tax=Pseudomonas sp. PNP TaxID=361819 RepID=UPI001AECB07D|nr:integrase [Pseudomonas sp. PNP]MBP2838639.1 integrase [Pseudomonas sp. PNP]
MSSKPKKPIDSPVSPQKKAHLQTDAFYGMRFSRIGSGLVMSRSTDGEVISLFEDDEWYLPAFAYSVTDVPYFSFVPCRIAENAEDAEDAEDKKKRLEINAENVATCKRLFTMKMFSTKSRTGKPIRLTTMHAFVRTLERINSVALKYSIRIQEVFGAKKIFEEVLATLPISYYKVLLALIRTLDSIDSKERAFTIDGSILPFLRSVAIDARNDGQQHPVIPSRILWTKYKQYNACLIDYVQHRDAIHELVNATAADRFLGKNRSTRIDYRNEFQLLPIGTKMAYKKDPPTFWKTIEKYGLIQLARKNNWKSLQSIASFLGLVQHCAKCLIHLFTLMRDAEVMNLPVDCLEHIRGWNNEALYVCGTSTKLESEKTNAKWITTDDICKPVEVLQSIQKLVASQLDDNADVDWLFLAVSNLPWSKSPPGNMISRKNYDDRLPDVIITEADISELETIDPYRNWRDDKKFQIGKPWRVTSHQFRRSIAVFAGQSGLITLPSLKRLLRHITKVMAAYYMKGCSAKNYLFSDLNPKLTLELKRAKKEADAALYIRDVLNSAEQMYGFAGRRAMEMRKESFWLPGTEEQTKRQTNLGLMAYEETPAGGCTSPIPCDKRAHAKMDTCGTCKQFVGQEAKMAETIEIMEFDLAELKPGTIEYRAELQNLEDFKAFRDRVIARG